MKVWKVTACLVFGVVLFLFGGFSAQGAGFSVEVTETEVGQGDTLEVDFTYDGTLGPVAAFRAEVQFDPTVLEYIRPQLGDQVAAGTTTTRVTDAAVQSVYTAHDGITFLENAETALSYQFRVREEASGPISLHARLFDAVDPQPSPLPSDVEREWSIALLPPPSGDARLLSLIPETGVLSPTFSPEQLEYTMSVPYEVTSLTFTAEAAEGATFWVNRKNLGSGGETVEFRITVTAEDGKTKQVYTVLVYREEKEESQPEESSDARLLSLTPETGNLSPAFSPEQLEYSMSVPYEIASLTFTAEAAEGATFWVNRKNLGSGGETVEFRITVTAKDGKTKQIYRISVYRREKETSQSQESQDARLLSLTPATGTLSPAFSPDRLEYTMDVPFTVTSMTFTGEPAKGATFRVNRKNLGAGGSDTVFLITVTAEDKETKQVYQVTVHRNEKSSTTGAGSITTDSSNSAKGSSGSSTSSKSTKAESSQSDVSSSPAGASSHTGEETLQEEETTVPVAAEEDQKGGGSSGGTVSGGQGEIPVVTDEENQVSLLPGMLILLAFLLFGFLSGPLSKWIAKQLEDGSRNYKPKHPSTPNLP